MRRLVTFALAAMMLAGCNGKMYQTAQKNKEIAKKAYAMMAAKDMDNFMKLMTPTFVDHNPMPGQKAGMDGVKDMFSEMYTAFPDLNMQVDQIVAEGDMVSAKVTMTGTQTGPFHGMPASGKAFKMEGMDMLKFVDGKVSDRWGVFDEVSMMTQLGMMPAPGAEQAKSEKMEQKAEKPAKASKTQKAEAGRKSKRTTANSHN